MSDSMRAMQLVTQGLLAENPLRSVTLDIPSPAAGQLLLKVQACGVCHTDLHTVVGEIHPPRLPVIPGHQVLARVEAVGEGVKDWRSGQRAGVPWLYSACGKCSFCLHGNENLCLEARFTGFHVDGGYAEYMLSRADYTLPIPDSIPDDQVPSLLCAGIIGYRSLRLADLAPGERIGLVGFGASAHLAIQVAKYWGCEVYVFTRSSNHRELATRLGAAWVGGVEEDQLEPLDRAIIFAPSGDLVPAILSKLRPGGTLAINAIHMSTLPAMPYSTIYGERTLRSVSNATYHDGVEFLRLAAEIPIHSVVVTYPLAEANRALQDLAASLITGAGVLLP